MLHTDLISLFTASPTNNPNLGMQSQLCYFGGSVHAAPAELKIKKP